MFRSKKPKLGSLVVHFTLLRTIILGPHCVHKQNTDTSLSEVVGAHWAVLVNPSILDTFVVHGSEMACRDRVFQVFLFSFFIYFYNIDLSSFHEYYNSKTTLHGYIKNSQKKKKKKRIK